MAIAFGAMGTQDTTGSYTSLAMTGSARLGVIFAVGDSAGDNLTGITWGGVAMTKIAAFRPGTDRYCSAWYVVNPTSASTITLTGGTYKESTAWYYTGVKTTAPLDSFATGTSAANAAIAVATTVVATGCWTVMMQKDDGVGSRTYTTTVGTMRINTDGGGKAASDSNATVGTGSQSTTLTQGAGTDNHGAVAFSIAPASSFTIAETSTLTETTSSVFGRSTTILETFTLTETVSVIRTAYTTIVETITQTDTWISPVITLWRRQAKNIATLINRIKN